MNRKYVDANIFIQAIVRNEDNCIKVLEKIINKEFIGVTNILSWDELTFIIEKFLGKNIAETEGNQFLIFPNLVFIDAKRDIIIKAQKLYEQYKIKPRDAIHAATALSLNIDEIISEDSDFDCIKELKRIKP